MNERELIAGFIQDLINEPVSDHASNLFEQGILTSLDVLDLLAFLENTFGLEISEEDVDMESFGTIDGLVGLVERKRNLGVRQ
ncbi:acyl carrier protein [Paenibacillus durus]|uniref:Carrier domain-containing protein n=1 Tax=Paenibacillus durus ATCC 35681 TaxID=1333534 RepID=A0A0F7FAA6_PAEDU|nr:acyl carrier protein [Paenibacillus durus]AKG35134.1 hypothetical protein VK70_11625 [Paenibacillus durus ATCC 35681]